MAILLKYSSKVARIGSRRLPNLRLLWLTLLTLPFALAPTARHDHGLERRLHGVSSRKVPLLAGSSAVGFFVLPLAIAALYYPWWQTRELQWDDLAIWAVVGHADDLIVARWKSACRVRSALGGSKLQRSFAQNRWKSSRGLAEGRGGLVDLGCDLESLVESAPSPTPSATLNA
jgi:hypothetical protein